MREFKFNLKHPQWALKKSGYNLRANGDYTREDGSTGRFHVKKDDYKITLHYDVYIEGKHTVFDMPMTLRKEERRIRRHDSSPIKVTVVCQMGKPVKYKPTKPPKEIGKKLRKKMEVTRSKDVAYKLKVARRPLWINFLLSLLKMK